MAEELDSAPLTAGTESAVPRIKFSETGQPGLNILGGSVLESCSYELAWPYCIHTFNKMKKDPTIASAIQLLETMISKVKWHVEIPYDASDDLRKKKQFMEEVLIDMDTSLFQVIKEVSSFNTYGFCVMEKVFRRRLTTQGSYFNDGLVGLKKIAPRGQETIAEWEFDENQREIRGLRQWTKKTNTQLGNFEVAPGEFIPRDKFLLFRANVRKNNPTGESPLLYCWSAWKFKQALEEAESIGISKDLRGLPVVYMPVQYMAEGASEADKAVFEYMKKVVRNIHREEQEGVILPSIYDDQGHKLFNFELAGVQGSKSYDVGSIIERYSNEILMSFFADVLKLGQGGSGSYSLADSKSSMIATRIESALMEIQDQFNNDLIPQLAKLNGWNPVQMPKLAYGEVNEVDWDNFSKAIQRVKAVGLITPTAKNINHIAQYLNLPDRLDEDMTQEEINQLLGQETSRSGDGLTSGMPSGTGNADGSGGDSSTNNTENASVVRWKIISETEDFVDVQMNGQTIRWMTEDWKEFVKDTKEA